MQDPQDLIDRLISDWSVQAPDFNLESMSVVGRILRLARFLDAGVSDVLKPLGLHYTDFDVLATLRRVGRPHELTPTELLRSVLITSGAMTASLGRLQQVGLVERGASDTDRRIKTVALTRKGARLVDRAAKLRFAQADESLEALSLAERETLSRLLRKLLVSLDSAQ